MADPISTTGAALGAVTTLIQVGSKIKALSDTFKTIPDEHRGCRDELGRWKSILHNAMMTAETSNDRSWTSKLRGDIDHLIFQLDQLLDQLISKDKKIKQKLGWTRLAATLSVDGLRKKIEDLDRRCKQVQLSQSQLLHERTAKAIKEVGASVKAIDGIMSLTQQCRETVDKELEQLVSSASNIDQKVASLQQSSHGTASTLEIIQQTVQRFDESLVTIQQEMRIDIGRFCLPKIIEWISTNAHETTYHKLLQDFNEGTLETFFHSPEFDDWKTASSKSSLSFKERKSDLLWVYGPPGVGKSTLASVVLHRLRAEASDVIVADAYCKYSELDGMTESQAIEHIITGLVRNAIGHFSTLPDYVHDIWTQHGTGTKKLSLASCLNLLRRLLANAQRSFIVVDAMDELVNESQKRHNFRRLVKCILDIKDRVNESLQTESKTLCKVFITSREPCYPRQLMIEESLLTMYELAAVENDIKLLVLDSVDNDLTDVLSSVEYSDDGGRLREKIQNQIISKAQGNFLLPTLHLNYLVYHQDSAEEIEIALHNLPSNLEESHAMSMKRINDQSQNHREKGMRILAWVYCAKPTLSFSALRQALALSPEDEVFNCRRLDLHEGNFRRFTAGLVTVHGDEISFVHYSVREYLTQTLHHWLNDVHHGHIDIAMQCIQFLKLRDFTIPLRDGEYHDRCRDFPFLEYAASNLGFHVSQCPQATDTTSELYKQCSDLATPRRMPYGSLQIFAAKLWSWNLSPSRVKSLHLSKPHLAVLCNLVEVANYETTSANIGSRADKHETVLHYAARVQSLPMMKMLLQKEGADLFAVNLSGKTVLDIILAQPYQKIVMNNIMRSVQAFSGISMLSAYKSQIGMGFSRTAISNKEQRRGNSKAVAEINNIANPMLDVIVEQGDETEDLERILKLGLQIDITDEGEELAIYLIQAGVDPDSFEMGRQTPLQFAALYGRTRLAQLLLEMGADPFLCRSWKLTPYAIALRRGDWITAAILQQEMEDQRMDGFQADANTQDESNLDQQERSTSVVMTSDSETKKVIDIGDDFRVRTAVHRSAKKPTPPITKSDDMVGEISILYVPTKETTPEDYGRNAAVPERSSIQLHDDYAAKKTVSPLEKKIEEVLPSDSISIIGEEPLIPKMHRCSKGQKCHKWQKQYKRLKQLEEELSSLQNVSIEEEGHFSGSDWVPSLIGSSNIIDLQARLRSTLTAASLKEVASQDPQENIRAFLKFQMLSIPSES